MRMLLVVDMQNDFITGSLGSPQAQAIVPAVQSKIESHRKAGDLIMFTRDTHFDNYLDTQEGRRLPVIHCIKGTDGHKIAEELETAGCEIIDKYSFGALDIVGYIVQHAGEHKIDEIELCGLCSDICVVSNALILKAALPETTVTVDASCCAGVTEESHQAALTTMRMCQVNVVDGR